MLQRYKNLLTLVIFILAAVFIWFNVEQFLILKNLRVVDIASISATLLLFFVASGVTFHLLLNLVGVRLRNLEVVGLSFLTNMVNYLAPLRPGAAIKAMYLKSVKELDYSRFTSVFAANAFLVLATTSGFAMLLLGFNWYSYGLLPWDLLLVSLAFFTLSMIPFTVKSLSWIKIEGKGNIPNTINNAIEGFEQIRGQKLGITLVCGSVIFQFMVSGVLMLLVYKSIGIELSYQIALMLGVFTALANLFTITPNNMGVQEAVMGYLVMVMGGDFNQGFVGAVILRAIHLALTFSVGSLLVQRMLMKANLKFKQVLPS